MGRVRCFRVLPLFLFPLVAHAAEGEKTLSVGASYARFAVTQDVPTGRETVTGRGGALGLDFEHGLGESTWFRLSAQGGLYDAPEGAGFSASATAGIVYTFDVLRYVPHLSAAVGVMALGSEGGSAPKTSAWALIELGLGVDVLRSRDASWGVTMRYASFVADLSTFTIGPRVTWRWGYF
ncbi:MAG: hypothetical protein HY698_09500 [Deltaproteobacteria bacterium]|nr:hypothetical protein [Deltaproteobacteria bacterium]